ncbi:metal ABC transporter ATP-binding protein [Schaalia suimastitidis]|uniref:metal ABC transporter ATP-binding protein n=1 Tax=Schaalia suimastitidis TaxID=121163 RepID=UPI0003FF8617|nr:metal ABC transporter ATP-binding protein [Schaalia suimastitidis]
MTTPAHSALNVDSLSVAYRDIPVLRNATIEIPQGTVTGIVGPNGAGKSTLLKAALGILPSLSGAVTFFGQPLEHVRRRVGYMPQSASVDWDFPATVHDVVLMGTYGSLRWGRRPNAKQKAQAQEALARVDMSAYANRQIGELSGGQKQRVFLARVLAQDPELFLMDEPFAGIDAASERSIMDVLVTLREQGRTVVLVHHDLSSLKRVCDRVVLLNHSVIAHGSIDDVMTAANLRAAYGTPAMEWAEVPSVIAERPSAINGTDTGPKLATVTMAGSSES